MIQEKLKIREVCGDKETEIIINCVKDSQTILAESTKRKAQSASTTIVSSLKSIFLPQGFPSSVHSDYISYQIWDTIQAFASTIMGTLTTRAIMQGVGVGNASMSALAAAITWILKDGTGMIGRIMFAWWKGTDLDRQCKKWRLLADVLNDIAMGIELLIPYISTYSMPILCISSSMKSIVGVAGGATRVAITQHQALKNNLADVSAKDGSQETCVNLLASLLGIFILSFFENEWYLIYLFILLMSIHIYANYSAVKALHFNSLNEDRLVSIITHYILEENIPHIEIINREEPVFLFSPLSAKKMHGFEIKLGVSIKELLRKKIVSLEDIENTIKLFKFEKYMIFVDVDGKTIFVCLMENAESTDVLRAYLHGCFCAIYICMRLKWSIAAVLNIGKNDPSHILLRIHTEMRKYSNSKLPMALGFESVCAVNSMTCNEHRRFVDLLRNQGWIIETNVLPVGICACSWDVHHVFK